MKKEEIRVTVWNEFRHEKSNEGVKKIYQQISVHFPAADVLHRCNCRLIYKNRSL